MARNRASLRLSGDIDLELAGQISALVRARWGDVDVVLGDVTDRASLTVTPDAVAVAQALTAIINCALTFYTVLNVRNPPSDAAVADAVRKELLAIDARGFEVVRVRGGSESIVVSLRDIPAAQAIETEVTTELDIAIRRRRLTGPSHKET